jgi:hypothetical protein
MSAIVSPSSVRADREVKPPACAKAGIAFYLLMDRLVKPVTITLFSQPSEEGYGRAERVPAGPSGGTLHIPSPFGITLDTTTMPIPA